MKVKVDVLLTYNSSGVNGTVSLYVDGIFLTNVTVTNGHGIYTGDITGKTICGYYSGSDQFEASESCIPLPKAVPTASIGVIGALKGIDMALIDDLREKHGIPQCTNEEYEELTEAEDYFNEENP